MKNNKKYKAGDEKKKRIGSKAAKMLTAALIVLVAAFLVLDGYLIYDRYIIKKPEETTGSSTIRSGDYIYKIKADGSAELHAYYGSGQNVVIPPELDGYTLTSLGEDCFTYAFSVTKLVIPEGVKTIGDYAFAHCGEMKEITVPGSVESIGKGAFYSCDSLKKVYYAGTKEQWQALNIPKEDNEALAEAVYFYNYTGGNQCAEPAIVLFFRKKQYYCRK